VLTNTRTFYRVFAGALAYGWILYVVSGGFSLSPSMRFLKIVPVILSVIAIWAAAVEEEVILWTMCVFMVLFGFGFASSGMLPVVWAGFGLLVVVAVSKETRASPGERVPPQYRRS
jgi:hypothetical protein